jgi:hypothetical protein
MRIRDPGSATLGVIYKYLLVLVCAGGGGGPGAHGGDGERALRGQDPQGGDRT